MATHAILQNGNFDSLPIQNVISAVWSAPSGGTITYTVLTHGYTAGLTVTTAGFTPSGYDGTFAIAAVTTDTFTRTGIANPGAASVLGTVQASWVNGENFTVNNGATLTANTSSGVKRVGMNGTNNQNVITVNNGRLLITNSSHVTAIRWTWAQIASTQGSRVINLASGLALLEIQGDYIEIGTGDGTANQVMTLPYDDYTGAVMVETGNATNEYEPWLNVGNTNFRHNQGIWRGLALFAGDERGKVYVQGATALATITQSGINATTLWTNQITFGDDANGKKIPTGARVRVPNIVITDESSRTTYTSTALATNGNVTMPNGGRLIANWCNFGYVQIDGTGAQQLTFNNCCFLWAPLIVRCAQLTMDTVGIGTGFEFPAYTTNWLVGLTNAYTRNWQQISGAQLTKLAWMNQDHIAEGGTTTSTSTLTITFSDAVTLDRCRFFRWQRKRNDERNLTLSTCSNVVANDCSFFGAGVTLATTTTCAFTGSKWSNAMNDWLYGASSTQGHITHDPATKARLVNGTRYYLKVLHRRILPLTLSYDADADGFWLSTRVYSATPYAGAANHPLFFGATPYANNVVLKWARQDPSPIAFTISTGQLTSVTTTATMVLPVGHGHVTGDVVVIAGASPGAYNGTYTLTAHTATSVSYTFAGGASPATGTITITLQRKYEIYRSTTWGSLGTLLTTVTAVNATAVSGTDTYVEIYTDATAVNGTPYYYTLRKYDRPGVYTDSAQQEATPTADESVTNLLLQTQTFDNASWTKTNGSITANGSRSPMETPFANTTATGDLFTPSGDGSITQVVAATPGTTYTFSVFLRMGAATSTNPTFDTQISIIDNGSSPLTTNVAVTVHNGWTRFWVTQTVSAGATQITCRIGGDSTLTAGKLMYLSCSQLVVGSVPGPYIGPNTTASQSSTPWYFTIVNTAGSSAQAIGVGAMTFDGGQEIAVRLNPTIPTLVSNAHYVEVHLSTNPAFTPSAATLAWNNFLAPASASPEAPQRVISLNTGSNGNRFLGWDQIGDGGFSPAVSGLVYIDASNDNEIRELSARVNGFGVAPSASLVVFSASTSFNTLLHDWQVDGMARTTKYTNISAMAFTGTNTVSGARLQNIRCDVGGSVPNAWTVNGVVQKGVFGGRTYPGGAGSGDMVMGGIDVFTQSVYLLQSAVFDSIFNELYTSPTQGMLVLFMTASSADTPPYTILSGTPSFDNAGRLQFGTPGDSVVWEWPHKILGVSGFRTEELGRNFGPSVYLGSAFNASAMGDSTYNDSIKRLSALKLEYAIDTGSGYGAFTRLTAANLTAETVSATTGFRIKIKATAMRTMPYSARTTAFVLAETINGLTSGATAVIDEIFETPPFQTANASTTGVLWVSSVTGNWLGAETIRSGVTARATTIASPYQILPVQNQAANNTLVRGLALFTNVDQTVKYQAGQNTLTLTNIVAGSRLVIRNTSTLAILVNVSVPGTSYSYTYGSDVPIPVEILLRKGSAAPYYKQWRTTTTLSASDQSISALQDPDQ